MELPEEFVQRLDSLRNILAREYRRELDKMARREHARAKVVAQTGDVAIIKTEMKFESGELVGERLDGRNLRYIGFVVDIIKKELGGWIYVLNKRAVESRDVENEFEICKAGFTHLLEKRMEVLSRAEEILSRFEFAEPSEKHLNLEYYNVLDEYERKAVNSACSLEKGEILMVMGPPGTGKTQFISEASRITGKYERVLVTAQTHQSVDNALERLSENVDYALRIGPLTKVSEKVIRFSPEHKYIKKIRSNLDYEELAENYSEAFKKIRSEQDRILYRGNYIVGATAPKVTTNPLRNLKFDTAFIDEAHNMCISTALFVLERVQKVVIAGDVWQIPPVYSTVPDFSERAKFGTFNFLYELMKNEVRELLWLRNHYRCNKKIIGFSAKYIYDGNVKIMENCKNEKLDIETTKERWQNPDEPLVFINVDGEEEGIKSKINQKEARTVAGVVCELIEVGVNPEDIIVLTPYNSQVRLIEKEIQREIWERGLNVGRIDVKTVHGYLGGEKDVVVFSITATTPTSFYFIDKRMVNVVVTRAKKKLIVVGNARKIAENQNAQVFELLRYILENGVYELNL